MMLKTMPTHAIAPTTQLAVAPMVPLWPPPNHWYVTSSGATVRPVVTRYAAPRQISSPASVTMNAGTCRKAMMNPCRAPIAAPRIRPTTIAISHSAGKSCPKMGGRISACVTAMIMPTKPRNEPTERSMLRETIMSTMPLARMAMVAVWTDRFQRLRGDRNRPLEAKLKPIQMTARAINMPIRRTSTSVA